MREILGEAKTVRKLLKGEKYSIDYYQREYKWRDKQIWELVDDLSGKFLEEYSPDHSRNKVADYPHYFLGSIIISKKDNTKYIVDGQQRITSLTLLFILLRNLQKDRCDYVNVDEMIFSEKYGQKSFNLDVEERADCIEALYEGKCFNLDNSTESVQNIYQRYQDLETCFPEELRGNALPYFIDWLLENVHLVEIIAYSDDDAYTIFETMNDRGLSLSPTEMLKGYLLTNITDISKRNSASNRWRDRILKLNAAGKDVEPDFFKAWLRSQYATKIRERKKGAKPEDFDRISTEFHRWLHDASETIGLKRSSDFYSFIDRDFEFYSRQYLRLVEASKKPVEGLECIFYNAQIKFTLQHMLLLAPLRPDDKDEIIKKKLRIVSRFLDILLNWRIWNLRSISYSTMQYYAFLTMHNIRGMEPESLAHKLYELLCEEEKNLESNPNLSVHQWNRQSVHRVLARLTYYVEMQSGHNSHYIDYVREGGNRYEIEHIWADHPERHIDEFSHSADFAEYRNRIGGLLLLPKSSNASYKDLPYDRKLPYYYGQNLLARSLNPQCYERNTGFLNFMQESGLPFKAHIEFKKVDIDERSSLYLQLAKRIWNSEDLLHEVEH